MLRVSPWHLVLGMVAACEPAEIGVSRPLPARCTPTGPEVGLDGVDNDCDGQVDCDDPDLTEPFRGVVTEATLHVVCADTCPREVPHGIELRDTDIEDLSALSCVTTTPSIELVGNQRLRSLEGMPLLRELDVADLTANPRLASVDGWSGLERIGDLSIRTHPALERLELPGDVQGMWLVDNEALTEVVVGSTRLDRLSLSSLPALTGIYAPSASTAGTISIAGLPALVELGDLSALRHVDSVSIAGNTALVGLTHLDALETIGTLSIGPVRIDKGSWYDDVVYCPSAFRTLAGLANVREVGSAIFECPPLDGLHPFAPDTLGSLWAVGIDDLSPLDGTVMTDHVSIGGATTLGFSSTTHLKSLTLSGVHHLDTLEALRVVEGDLLIEGLAPDVLDLAPLAGLEEVGEVSIEYTTGLEHVALPGLRAGSLRIHHVPTLRSVSGFTSLHATDVVLWELPDDARIDLSGVTQVDGELFVRKAPVPFALGFTEVGEDVTLWNTPATHLDALALRRIGGTLRLDGNTDLVDVTGLYDLTEVGGSVVVEDNEALPKAAVRELVESIDTIGGTVTRRNNGP